LELLVKERLTGAIILVVLIVLLVPELLSGPKGPAATPPAAGAASPSSEEPPLRSYTIHLGDDSHTQSETANGAAGSSGPPQPTQPAQPTTQAATPEKDLTESSSWDSSTTTAQNSSAPAVETQPSLPAPKPAPEPKPASAAPKANQPAPNVAARAERAAAPDKATSKPHPAPAASESGGWGVQLGVFASKENAERLALDVRTKGFKVSVSPVTSGKRKLYRVRVGPAADKSAAQDLQSKLKAAGRPGGTVVPYS
jgi:DedD protein